MIAEAAVLIALLVALPLLGLALGDRPITPYLELPPRTRPVPHAPYSPQAFALFAALALAATGLIGALAWPRRPGPRPIEARPQPFPWWGWAGLAWLAGAWLLAWTRFGWMEALQPYTFAPIWVGYVVAINAHTFRRTGHCLLRDRPGFLLALFLASAVFWWYFEYLNHFVQNWYYVGVQSFGPRTYVLHASLAFSTVLPAVTSTMQWLHSYPLLRRGYARPVRIAGTRGLGLFTVLAAGLALAGLAAWPELLFPLVWMAPLLLVLGIQALRGEPTWFADLASGRWERLYLPALAAPLCGLLWEMWNFHSQAKWVYSIPFVQRYHLFEMPLLGYTGYLPFGLECAVIADLVGRAFRRPPQLLPTSDRRLA
ncbi:MAG: hypothetical protein GWO16_03160 [Gammaproteobacteria bacterium]|nr:hypothetical protein [Gammaproteobacteria bacterium]NIX11224.1 hypothetical protein [Gammaproteobacteria bacterium]